MRYFYVIFLSDVILSIGPKISDCNTYHQHLHVTCFRSDRYPAVHGAGGGEPGTVREAGGHVGVRHHAVHPAVWLPALHGHQGAARRHHRAGTIPCTCSKTCVGAIPCTCS